MVRQAFPEARRHSRSGPAGYRAGPAGPVRPRRSRWLRPRVSCSPAWKIPSPKRGKRSFSLLCVTTPLIGGVISHNDSRSVESHVICPEFPVCPRGGGRSGRPAASQAEGHQAQGGSDVRRRGYPGGAARTRLHLGTTAHEDWRSGRLTWGHWGRGAGWGGTRRAGGTGTGARGAGCWGVGCGVLGRGVRGAGCWGAGSWGAG
jgi:hypothetical protein